MEFPSTFLINRDWRVSMIRGDNDGGTPVNPLPASDEIVYSCMREHISFELRPKGPYMPGLYV